MSDVYVNTRGIIRRRRDGQVAQQAGIYSRSSTLIGGSSEQGITLDSIIAMLSEWFTLEGTSPNQYLRCKFPFACDYDVAAYSDTGWLPPSIWDSMPAPSTTTRGGIILGSGSEKFLREDGTWQTVSAGGSMVYPGAGIPISTGSAWGSSITNNSANWNTAFGWGNHASAGYLTAITKAMVEAVLTGVITSHTHSYEPLITKTTGYLRYTGSAWEFKNETYSLSSHNHAGTYQPLDADLTAIAALAGTLGFLKKTAADTWSLDTATYLTSISKAMVEAVLTGTITSHNHAGTYQPLDADLTAIAALAGTSGFLKKTAADTWSLDTSTYLTAITKAMVEAVLTGTITSHNHTGTYQPLDADLTAIAAISGTSGLLRKTAADTWSLDTSVYVTGSSTATFSNKTINATNNTITDTSIAAGDLLKSNGSKFIRFARGTANQVLRVNSTGTDLEYATINSLVTANFSILQESGKLVIKYGSTVILSISSAGLLTAANDVVAYGTP